MDATEVEPAASNRDLLEMIKDQKEIIAMMQIQLDLQKEKLDRHEELILALQAQLVKDKTETGLSAIKEEKSIAEMAKETAEQVLAQGQTDYTFDEATGLYYDRNSGYYYDSKRQLFYNGHTRTYYSLDPVTNAYVFHSQLPEDSATEGEKIKRKSKKRKKTKLSEPADRKIKIEPGSSPGSGSQKSCKEDVEEGEISESSEQVSNDEEEYGDETDTDTVTSQRSDATGDSRKREESIPCLRAVVMESSVLSLPKGFLFLVTCMGGTVGREGSHHSMLLPDTNVSKHHAEISYSYELEKYFITDVGSQNGTILNGERISNPKEASVPVEILHGSTLKVGATTMLVHIHSGSLTCALCEPGLIPVEKKPMYDATLTKSAIERLRKKEMRQLRRKYGIEGKGDSTSAQFPEAYKDRAEERRVIKGSDNPFEKTYVASVDEAIKGDNKGFQMLSKMGWNKGTSLGRSAAAVPDGDAAQQSSNIEPIKVDLRPGRVGLGYESLWPAGYCPIPEQESAVASDGSQGSESKKGRVKKGKASRSAIAKKTMKRFNEIPQPAPEKDL